jgi:hypothetical protein
MYKQAISTVSGEGVSGMTITSGIHQGACLGQSAPALRMPGRRLSAANGPAAAPGRPMAAVPQAARDLVPAIVIA